MSDFSQESGRAGRNGVKACSIVIISQTWKPQLNTQLAPDEEAMQLYLIQEHCSRGVLSQFLDTEPYWRWCIAEDKVYQVCVQPYVEPRPVDLKFSLP
jgi:superfamily II DNA helicase RecQ